MIRKALAYIREHGLVHAGDRIGVAVSGGVDSVALLRAMLELGVELGAVIAVVHLHHGIRGAEADADAAFVAGLARQFELELHSRNADVPEEAAKHRLGLEAAGRKLRYRYFAELMDSGLLDTVATAHTADDQAETVLLRAIRGAGSRGLAGIHPSLRCGEKGRIIRPLLSISRCEIEDYLHNLGQAWREDTSNRDRRFLRNRVRHELLPTLERDYNPSIRRVLTETAEIAREEEEFWQSEVERAAADALIKQDRLEMHIARISGHSIALQRRIIRHAARQLGVTLDFHHVENIRLLYARGCAKTQLPNSWLAERCTGKIVIRQGTSQIAYSDYEYDLPIPGEVSLPEAHIRVRATLIEVNCARESYNPVALLDPEQLPSKLLVRNWRAGDRFQPLHRRSPEKLKRLLQEKKIVQPEKLVWPVAAYEGGIVWVRGFPVAAEKAFKRAQGRAILIEALPK